jgi:hypothetical protein
VDFDTASASVGAGAGVVFWELLKQLIGLRIKRVGDRNASKRKQLGDQCAAAKGKVNLCLQSAIEYLTSDCTEVRKRELGRTIRHEVAMLGQAVKDVNLFAADLNLMPLPSVHLIGFRRAVTWHIDSKSYKPQPHDAVDVRRSYEAGLAFQEALTRLQLDCS